jgi:hypothetical protein
LNARFDVNGSLLAASFNEDEVKVMQDVNDLASGLFVQIDRVVTQNFPRITMEVSVTDRNRHPIVGLQEQNFLLSEGGAPVKNQTFLGTTDDDARAEIVVLVERSPAAYSERARVGAAIRDIYTDIQGSAVSIAGIVSAGVIPQAEGFENDVPASVARAALGREENYSRNWHFDTGLRFAATEALPLLKKRAVVFITTGELGGDAFLQYSVSELAAYLTNNGIAFYAVMAGQGGVSDEITYLCGATGGELLRLYGPEGLGKPLLALAQKNTGVYLLHYTSQLPSDFGRAFLNVEAEVYLLERSGRDRIGYFAPLE